ncbi:gag-pol polyprotein [Tanacetum coccineum]
MKDNVVPNNSKVNNKKTEVEDHPRISSISNKTKSVTACNDNLKSRTSNAIAVYATCGKCLVNSDHFACVTKLLNDVNSRTKKPNVVPISTRKPKGNLKLLCNFVERYLGTVRFGNDKFAPILGYGDLVQGNITINMVYYVEGLNHNLFSVGQFCDADLEVAFRKSTCFVKDLQGNDLLTAPIKSVRTDRGTKFLNKTLHAYFKEEGIEHQTSTPRTPEQNGVVEIRNRNLVEAARTMLSASKLPLFFWAEAIATACLVPQRQKASDYDNSGPVPQLQNVSSSADTTTPSQQELDLLFGPLYDEFFNEGTSSVNKSSSLIDNSKQQDTPPIMNIQSSTKPTTPTTTVNAEENNNDNQAEIQVDNAHVEDNEFYKVFSTPVREET